MEVWAEAEGERERERELDSLVRAMRRGGPSLPQVSGLHTNNMLIQYLPTTTHTHKHNKSFRAFFVLQLPDFRGGAKFVYE